MSKSSGGESEDDLLGEPAPGGPPVHPHPPPADEMEQNGEAPRQPVRPSYFNRRPFPRKASIPGFSGGRPSETQKLIRQLVLEGTHGFGGVLSLCRRNARGVFVKTEARGSVQQDDGAAP